MSHTLPLKVKILYRRSICSLQQTFDLRLQIAYGCRTPAVVMPCFTGQIRQTCPSHLEFSLLSQDNLDGQKDLVLLTDTGQTMKNIASNLFLFY